MSEIKNSAHTPGPWVWCKGVRSLNSGNKNILILDSDYNSMSELSSADAALIAGSPDMLAALQAVKSAIDGLSYAPIPIDVENQVWEAIAKATGTF